MQRNRFNCPTPAMVPTVISSGALGTGSPIVSAKTQINNTVYPCWIRKGMILSMVILRGVFHSDSYNWRIL
jgi:hypothetical protein